MTKLISDILIESQDKRKQCIGSLVHFEGEKLAEHLPASTANTCQETEYCALGAIGCEIGLITKDHRRVSYSDILITAGVPDPMLNKLYTCTHCQACYDVSLASLIVHYNDSHDMTFKQIGEELKRLGI